MADHDSDTGTTGDETLIDDPAEDDKSGGSAIALGLLLLVVIVAIAAVVLATYDNGDSDTPPDDSDDVVVLPEEPAEEDVEEDIVEPDEIIGSDHALVGLTETEVRERYPLVRVVEVDGEPRPMTMDLLFGRVNLRIEDDVVVGADVEGCDEPVGEELAWAMQACDPAPSDGPTVSGTAVVDGDEITLGAPDDEYYDAMSLRGDDEQVPHITDLDGEFLSPEDIEDGDRVLVWTVGGCEESSPVQCGIGAIVVDRRA